MDIIKPYAQLFEAYLMDNLMSRDPFSLYAPADYILSLGGKRLRPVFVLMGYDLYGKNIKESLDAAMAIEVFHNFTLLHDDIMDKARIRRGKPTVHIKYSTNTAILTGDVMMIQAYQYLLNYDSPVLIKNLLSIFNKMAFEVCEGQQWDMDFETSDEVSIDQYLQMITLKTSVLMAASIQIGALLGGAGTKDLKHLYEFAKNFGIAFQIQDDVLDTFGDARLLGKQIGGDILQNKKTYLYLKALELANVEQKKYLNALYSNANRVNNKEKIKKVKEIFEDVLVVEYSNQLIEAYRDLSISHLNACQIDLDKKTKIIGFIDEMILRRN